MKNFNHIHHCAKSFQEIGTKMAQITIHTFTMCVPNSDDFLEFCYIVHPNTKKLWFSGVMLARSLKYVKKQHALHTHVRLENMKILSELIDGYVVAKFPKNVQRISIMVDEEGFNSLILGSRLPTAQAYKKWVCGEVLPNIRQKGYYVQSVRNTPNFASAFNASTTSSSRAEMSTPATETATVPTSTNSTEETADSTSLSTDEIPSTSSRSTVLTPPPTPPESNTTTSATEQQIERYNSDEDTLTLLQKIQRLEHENKERQVELVKFQGELNKYESKFAEFQNEVAKCELEVARYKQEYESEVARYNNEIVQYEDRIVQYEDKIVKYEDRIVQYEDRIVKYEEKIDNFVDTVNNYHNQNQVLEDEINIFRNELGVYGNSIVHMSRMHKRKCMDMERHTAEKIQRMTESYKQKEEECLKTRCKMIIQKKLKKYNIDICKKMMEKLEIAKNRTIPNIEAILPNKVHMIALYILDRNTESAFTEENRPFHYVSRSQKERIDDFDKMIADSTASLANAVHERADNGLLSTRPTKTIPKSCLWLHKASCYYKQKCPNAVTQWVDLKYWKNPLWFGIVLNRNTLKFLNKEELCSKLNTKNRDYKKFMISRNIRTVDDLLRLCYTPLENEKQTLQMLVEEDLQRTLKEFEINEKMKYTVSDLSMDELLEGIHNEVFDDDMEDDIINEALDRSRMITD